MGSIVIRRRSRTCGTCVTLDSGQQAVVITSCPLLFSLYMFT